MMTPISKILTHIIKNVRTLRFLFFLILFFYVNVTDAQVTEGFFGGDHVASGYSTTSNTTNKWIKLAEMSLNYQYHGAGITVDFFPRSSNHGDSRQQLIVQFRNGGQGTDIENTYDIELITFSGSQKTLKDAKVIRTSGTGTSNNRLSVWVQIGINWLSSVPIEIRKYGVVDVETTNQPYYTSITETGTTYSIRTYYGMCGDEFEVMGTVRAKELALEASPWPDYVFEKNYDLKDLSEVESFINQNGHLPNIPSAKEVENEGIKVGEMNAKLLEKIEELTLYAIEQEKQRKEQERINKVLLDRLERI